MRFIAYAIVPQVIYDVQGHEVVESYDSEELQRKAVRRMSVLQRNPVSVWSLFGMVSEDKQVFIADEYKELDICDLASAIMDTDVIPTGRLQLYTVE